MAFKRLGKSTYMYLTIKIKISLLCVVPTVLELGIILNCSKKKERRKRSRVLLAQTWEISVRLPWSFKFVPRDTVVDTQIRDFYKK